MPQAKDIKGFKKLITFDRPREFRASLGVLSDVEDLATEEARSRGEIGPNHYVNFNFVLMNLQRPRMLRAALLAFLRAEDPKIRAMPTEEAYAEVDRLLEIYIAGVGDLQDLQEALTELYTASTNPRATAARLKAMTEAAERLKKAEKNSPGGKPPDEDMKSSD